MRLAWANDVHLNLADAAAQEAFFEGVTASGADALLLAGDLAESDSLEAWLIRIGERARRPVYFVLGNHDYYGDSIAAVRARVGRLVAGSPWLRWLEAETVVGLTARTALVGHGGWADARFGDFGGSRVLLTDYFAIAELAGLYPGTRRTRLEALGDEAAAHLRGALEAALAQHARVVVLTHVPPFREAAWHEGGLSDPYYLPHFSCRATGEVLRAAALARPDRAILVLCGHTHGGGRARIEPNLAVRTGAAEYGHPALQEVIEVE
ncbi:MAG: metallophosphoesterase [Deltaproteobacteria bacterium]|nr:metallophosphoesterase [Deltaproteobacteria bacterium]